MDESTLHALEAQRSGMHARWDAMLRVEPVATPLGQPDALKHMIDFTLSTLFAALHNPHAQRRKYVRSVREWAADRSLCPCGKNPLLAYFIAGEQAVLETLILVQATLPGTTPEARAAAVFELKSEMAHVAHREIETFCALCQLRSTGTPGQPVGNAHHAPAGHHASSVVHVSASAHAPASSGHQAHGSSHPRP